MPTPEPGPGEIRIRLAYSGISPGDVKKRSGWQGSPMPYPRVIPHSDGSGVVDAAGPGATIPVGAKVWCYGAQSYRPFGTAAEYVVIPTELAVVLPDDTSHEVLRQAATLGIPGITGYRAVFSDGPVRGLTVLIHGAARGVGAVATQMAVRGGATVVALVRREADLKTAVDLGASSAFRYSEPGLAESIRSAHPDGVHRIADVDFAEHIDLNADVIAVGGVVSAYYSSQDRPEIPYWKLGFADTTLRLLGSDDFPAQVKREAVEQLTRALTEGQLTMPVAAEFGLEDIGRAQQAVESGSPQGKVVLSLQL